ncbi:hypothetical protein BJ138DRAFT_1119240 [Hygrophoropsis aurantiaca]|uniref:Uncharacterized protein n=1 Tax=Hygrophoropsis aurantiaca TaxID=72124 RepID=A0ACB7ZV80_9AGAM|nr:hypothetical protein BJ138DRAFT_1119240 [Hygrophoropsis aurantiaca]
MAVGGALGHPSADASHLLLAAQVRHLAGLLAEVRGAIATGRVSETSQTSRVDMHGYGAGTLARPSAEAPPYLLWLRVSENNQGRYKWRAEPIMMQGTSTITVQAAYVQTPSHS